ncbi:MAG: hypothetical protein AB7F59_11750 [Bdellovibrionales bacterium]
MKLFISLLMSFYFSGAQTTAPGTPVPKEDKNQATAADQGIKTDFQQGSEKELRNLDTNSHSLVRKIAVFPLDTLKKDPEAAEQSWWKIREELTNHKRFLIASRQMMLRKEVLQPRSELEPASAILIGKLLDAHALVTTYLRNRILTMTVYSSENGMILWKNEWNLSTSMPVSQQLVGASVKLIRDFVASVPYQGFQILDPLIGKPVYEESKALYAKVDSGQNTRIQVGDLIQWLHVRAQPPIFQNHDNLTVIAEGIVTENRQGVLTVEIKRMKDKSLLVEKTLIRAPTEYQRVKEAWALPTEKTRLSPDIYIAEMKSAEPESNGNKNMVMTGTTISSLLFLLLLAF